MCPHRYLYYVRQGMSVESYVPAKSIMEVLEMYDGIQVLEIKLVGIEQEDGTYKVYHAPKA